MTSFGRRGDLPAIRVLGAVEVIGLGGAVRLEGPQQQLVVALLAARRGHLVSSDHLIDALWLDGVPDRPARTLSVVMSRLRRSLPGCVGLSLVRAPSGWRLDVDPDRIDVTGFERLTGEAAELLNVGEYSSARVVSESALATWGGQPFGAMGSHPHLIVESRRLCELYEVAVGVHAESLSKLGLAHLAVPELEGQVARQPLRERSWLLLSQALADQGRTTESLRAIDSLRTVLEGVGLEVSPEARHVEREVLGSVHLGSQAMPPRSTDRFVGRGHELDLLDVVWRTCLSGESHTVIVTGDAGVGKTTLISEWIKRAPTTPDVVYGRARTDLSAPYQPIVEAMRSTDWRKVRHLDMVLEARGLGDPLDVTLDWLADLTRGGPAVAVLDDLHWAPSSTWRLIRYLLPLLPPRLLLIGIARDVWRGSESGAVTQFLDDNLSERHLTHMALMPLHRHVVAELAEHWTDRPLTETELDALMGATAGNPLAVLDIVHSTTRPSGHNHAMERLRRRLDSVPAPAREIVEIVAVAYPDCDAALLANVSDRSIDSIVADLDLLASLQLVVIDPQRRSGYTFTHDVFRELALAEMGPSRRALLHQAVARALTRAPARHRTRLIESIARHRLASLPIGSTQHAATAAVRAGDRALRLHAPDDAAQWYERAADLTARNASTPRHLSVLTAFGAALDQAGDRRATTVLIDAAHLAIALEQHDRLAEITLCNHWGAPRPDPSWHLIVESALTRFADRSETRARLLAELAVQSPATSTTRFTSSAEAVTLARQIGDPGILSFALHRRAMATWCPSTLTERLAAIPERRKAASATADLTWRWFVEMQAHTTALEAGDLTIATESLRTLVALSEKAIAPNQRAFTLCMQAWTAIRTGDLAQARQLADQAAAVGGPDDIAVAAHRAALHFALHRETASSDSRPDLRALRWWPVAVAAMQAQLDLDAGNIEGARTHLTSIAPNLASVSFDNAYLHTMMLVGDVAASLHDKKVCANVAQSVAPWADQIAIGMTGQGGSVHRLLALTRWVLGDTQAALVELARAVETADRLHALPWSLTARLDRAAILSEIGEHAGVADELSNIGLAAASDLTRIVRDAKRQATKLDQRPGVTATSSN